MLYLLPKLNTQYDLFMKTVVSKRKNTRFVVLFKLIQNN